MKYNPGDPSGSVELLKFGNGWVISPTLNWVYDYLSILRLNINHICKGAPGAWVNKLIQYNNKTHQRANREGCIPSNVPSNLYYKAHLVANKIVDRSDVAGASTVGAAPTTFSFATQHLASIYWAKAIARKCEKHFSFEFILEISR